MNDMTNSKTAQEELTSFTPYNVKTPFEDPIASSCNEQQSIQITKQKVLLTRLHVLHKTNDMLSLKHQGYE